MTPPADTELDHQMAAQDDEDMAEHGPDPAAQMLAGNLQPASGGVWHPGATAADRPAGEPEATGPDDAERPMTFTVHGAEPGSVPETPAATAAPVSTRWHEIQAMFVDDPRACAELAADLVDESIEALVAFARQQQDSMLASWRGQGAGTEELRAAVQRYRAFGTRLADFCRET
jgi:hypothetical protein